MTNLPTPISINILPPTVHPASIAIYPCHVALSATSVHALSLRFLIDPKKRLPLIVNLRISPNIPSGFIDHRRISFPTLVLYPFSSNFPSEDIEKMRPILPPLPFPDPIFAHGNRESSIKRIKGKV